MHVNDRDSRPAREREWRNSAGAGGYRSVGPDGYINRALKAFKDGHALAAAARAVGTLWERAVQEAAGTFKALNAERDAENERLAEELAAATGALVALTAREALQGQQLTYGLEQMSTLREQRLGARPPPRTRR